jgi:hypothetical protein
LREEILGVYDQLILEQIVDLLLRERGFYWLCLLVLTERGLSVLLLVVGFDSDGRRLGI